MLLLLHLLLIFSKIKDHYRNGKKFIILFILMPNFLIIWISHKIWKFWAICDSVNYSDTTYAQPQTFKFLFVHFNISNFAMSFHTSWHVRMHLCVVFNQQTNSNKICWPVLMYNTTNYHYLLFWRGLNF